MRSRAYSAVILALVAAGPSLAVQPSHAGDEGRIATCIHGSARGHVWLERTLWALRDTEGGWIGAAVPNRNGSYDLGPMQVNDWWVPRIARMLGRQDGEVAGWLRDDPCFNIEVARWIFLSSLAQAKEYWTAVGFYHSRNLHLRTAYARNVWTRYRRRLAADLIAARSPEHRRPSS